MEMEVVERSDSEFEVVEEEASREDRTEPLTSTNKGESSNKDASGEDGDGALETGDNESHMCDDEAALDDAIGRNASDNERNRVTL